MTEIQNPKREYDLEERTFQFTKPVLVIEYCNLRFICDLVLGIWNFSGLMLVYWNFAIQ